MTQAKKETANGARRVLKHLGALALAGTVLGGFGCLTRPVTNLTPSTKENFIANVKQQAVDKVDILFMIDNSASMGDKQDLLAQAVPDLVTRLLQPNCVDKMDPKVTVARVNGVCPDTAKEEFEPVHDMHIGIVTSSLGGGGADLCAADAKIGANEAPTLTKFSRHNDDRGHLINRIKPDPANPPASGVEDPITDAGKGNFLAWLPPSNPKNANKPAPPNGVVALSDIAQFKTDFSNLVKGSQEFGCGLEAQMEAWYRFLVQPDPYDSITLAADPNGGPQVATLNGVDAELLKQRADFLRPDSLLAIIAVTDEEDSWSDPMWLGGRGWITRGQNNTFSTTGQLPRGTSACDQPVDPNNPLTTGPNDPKCTWCAFNGTQSDPNCATNKGLYGPKEDGLNVRYTNDMKRRYGMTPQFPIERYVDGLKSTLVPNRQGEHYTTDGADAKLSSTYLGRKNCINPIYASELPTDPNGELCKLKRGARTSDLVFFAVIGGVPWQLLTEDPSDPNAAFKKSLTDSDWVKILGKDPATYQSEGIDPHMIESIKPRAGIACGTGAPSTCDKFHGREWDTLTSKIGIDLQYACTFTLPKAKDCTKLPEGATCDCGSSYAGPLCDPNPADGNNLTLQTRGKAYPTIREFRVAKKMGDNGVIASLCPRTLDQNNADYGYRPAVRAIVDRLKSVLSGQCLPQPLTKNPDGTVACLILVILPGDQSNQATACDASVGLKQPDPAVLDNYNKQRLADAQREANAGADGGTVPNPVQLKDLPPVCELIQLTPGDAPPKGYSPKTTCENLNSPGWCYVEGAAAGQCPLGQGQAIKFGLPPSGQTVIQCIQQTGGTTGTDGG